MKRRQPDARRHRRDPLQTVRKFRSNLAQALSNRRANDVSWASAVRGAEERMTAFGKHRHYCGRAVARSSGNHWDCRKSERSGSVQSGQVPFGTIWSGPIHSVGQSRSKNRHVGNHDIGPGIIKPVGCVGFLTGIMAATDKADTFHSGCHRRGDTGNGIFDDDG